MWRINRLAFVVCLVASCPAVAQDSDPVETRVVFVRDGVFTSPSDAAWDEVPEATYPLFPQKVFPPHGGGAVRAVSVRAVHDGEEIAFLLRWADGTADRGVGVDTFRDAAAIGFPAGPPGVTPSPFMGDAEHPVVIWQWAADFDADAEGRGRFGKRYPHAPGVWIFPQDLSVRRQVRGWRGSDPVIEYVARGFGTLAPRLGAEVAGRGRHEDGEWRLVLRRDLSTPREEDPVFVAGAATLMILAIWDGADDEVNGRKSVTYQWFSAKLDGTDSTTTPADVGAARDGE